MSLMEKNKHKLFIHKKMEYISLEQSVQIILTPEFYTLIREELDIRFTYQAKQIAEALFDDYLDTSKEYQYHATKHKDTWDFYAYNIEEIESFLDNIGIEKHRISKIYFAQELSNILETPTQLDDKTILQTIDGIVTLIPLRIMDSSIEYVALNLAEIKLSSGVGMGESHNSLVSLKETLLLSSIFFILGTIFIFEGNRIKSSISNDEKILFSLINENPNYGSSMLRENILQKYQPIEKNEKSKRQNIKEISKLLSSKSELTSFSIQKSKMIAEIKTSNINIAKQVSKNAEIKNFKSSISGQIVKLEKNL